MSKNRAETDMMGGKTVEVDRGVKGRSNGRTRPLDNSDHDVLLRRVMGQLLMMSSIPRSEAKLPDDLGWGSCLQIYLQF